MRGLLLALLATVAACDPPRVFHCQSSPQCGAEGVCEPVGYCSFADPACTIGRRYGELAPDGVRGACVGAEVDGGSDASSPSPDGAPGVDGTVAADGGSFDAGPPRDGAAPDAGGDGGLRVASFGETGLDQHANVTTDTWLASDTPTASFRAAPSLRVDSSPVHTALLRFDLTGLPPGSRIVSADLRLWTDGETQVANGQSSIRGFKVLQAWAEDRQTGTAGAASWNERLPGTAWSTKGAGQPGSRDTVSLGDLTATQSSASYGLVLPPALIQGWVNAPASNAGLALVARGNGTLSAHFESRESANAAHRPELVVTYRP